MRRPDLRVRRSRAHTRSVTRDACLLQDRLPLVQQACGDLIARIIKVKFVLHNDTPVIISCSRDFHSCSPSFRSWDVAGLTSVHDLLDFSRCKNIPLFLQCLQLLVHPSPVPLGVLALPFSHSLIPS